MAAITSKLARHQTERQEQTKQKQPRRKKHLQQGDQVNKIHYITAGTSKFWEHTNSYLFINIFILNPLLCCRFPKPSSTDGDHGYPRPSHTPPLSKLHSAESSFPEANVYRNIQPKLLTLTRQTNVPKCTQQHRTCPLFIAHRWT